jgi:hypothetical protein
VAHRAFPSPRQCTFRCALSAFRPDGTASSPSAPMLGSRPGRRPPPAAAAHRPARPAPRRARHLPRQPPPLAPPAHRRPAWASGVLPP